MTKAQFSYEDFIQYKNVSRETFLRLQVYVELLQKWQKTINLVSQSTISDVWNRHIIDSVQLIDHIKQEDNVADIGSGAGFPGLVLAIMGIRHMTLVESDMRKVAFLREAVRITESEVSVIAQRVEDTSLPDISVITARALAPIDILLNSLQKTTEKHVKLLLLKGKNYIEELNQARTAWSFDSKTFPSVTDGEGMILSITNISKRGPHE